MCIMFVYRNADAEANAYRLILAFNRDESLLRSTMPAHWWKEHPACLGGIDMEPGKEGGTWLAFSKEGRLGALLNLTGEKRSSATPGKGRGHLVTDYINSQTSQDDYLKRLHEKNHISQTYNPYNLILINLWNADISLLCSAENSEGGIKCIENILGFGNSAIDKPFKKVTEGKKILKNIIKDAKVIDHDKIIKNLLEFLKSDEKYLPDPELERRAPNWYKDLSSIFVNVKDQAYGTRTHSILLVDGSNDFTFVEETLMPDNKSWKYQIYKDKLKKDN